MSSSFWIARIADSLLHEPDEPYRVCLFASEDDALVAGCAEWGGPEYVEADEATTQGAPGWMTPEDALELMILLNDRIAAMDWIASSYEHGYKIEPNKTGGWVRYRPNHAIPNVLVVNSPSIIAELERRASGQEGLTWP